MKNYYTLKEVFLALRKEQLNFLGKLNNLEKCLSNYNDSYYYGSHFFQGMIDDIATLYYSLRINLDAHDRRYTSFISHHNSFRFEEFATEVIKRSNGNYDIPNNRVKVIKEKQDEFNSMIDNIVNDEFFKMGKRCISFEDNDGDKELVASCNNLIYANGDHVKNLKVSPRFTYYANKDLIICDFPFETIDARTDIVIEQMLNIKFPKEYFPEYMQKIIDNDSELEKEIVFPRDRIYERHVDFKLDEKDNTYVLKRNRY